MYVTGAVGGVGTAVHVDKPSCECARPWGLTRGPHLQWAPCERRFLPALVPESPQICGCHRVAGELRLPTRDGSGARGRPVDHMSILHLCPGAPVPPSSPRHAPSTDHLVFPGCCARRTSACQTDVARGQYSLGRKVGKGMGVGGGGQVGGPGRRARWGRDLQEVESRPCSCKVVPVTVADCDRPRHCSVSATQQGHGGHRAHFTDDAQAQQVLSGKAGIKPRLSGFISQVLSVLF